MLWSLLPGFPSGPSARSSADCGAASRTRFTSARRLSLRGGRSLAARRLRRAHSRRFEGEELQAYGIHTQIKEMTTAFEFDEVLPVGKGVLEIDFQGTLNDQMAGFYR